MAIRSDSFGSTSQVAAYCRWLLNGNANFDASSKPTLSQVESMIDEVSGQINLGLAGCGFTPSDVYGNSTAKVSIDGYVNAAVAERVELTYPGVGFNDGQGTRTQGFRNLYQSVDEYVTSLCKSLKKLDISVNDATSDGLAFTAIDKRSQRSDPTDASREQPLFRRRLFDNPQYNSADQDTD